MRRSKRVTIIVYALRMTAIGVALERNRRRLAKLIGKGYPCSDERVLRVYNVYSHQHDIWCDLEQRYLKMKECLIGGRIA